MRKILGLALIAWFGLAFPQSVTNSPIDESTQIENEIYYLVNVKRNSLKKVQLGIDNKIAVVARNYSKRMAKEGFFSHEDRNGENVVARVKKARIKGWRRLGENLYFGDADSKDFAELVVDAWLSSAGHRRNLLSDDWTQMGVGVYEKSEGVFYVTQIFVER
ncbi:MAG: CAP domain-containing protein [Pyrinomonadaceae bacterium]